MAKGQNAAKHYNREYWSSRPCSEWPCSKATKIVCHRLERRRMNRDAQREACEI